MREVRLRGASSRDESTGDMLDIGKLPASTNLYLIVPDFVQLRPTGERAGKHRYLRLLDHDNHSRYTKRSVQELEQEMQKANTLEAHKPPCKQNELKRVEEMQSGCDESGTRFVLVVKEKSETPVITNRERLGPWTIRGYPPPINTNSWI